MLTFLSIMAAVILSGMSTSAMSSQIKMDSTDDGPVESNTFSASQLSLAQIDENLKNLKIHHVMYSPDDIGASEINYQHHEGISKRDSISSPKMVSKQRNSPVCEGNSKPLCIYFYPDHPDAGRSRIKGNNYCQPITNNGTSEKQPIGSNQTISSICEDTSSFCTYFYPDHPDAGLKRMKNNYNNQSTATNIKNDGVIKQQAKDSNKIYLPLCEDSSSICTFKKKNNNHTAIICLPISTALSVKPNLIPTELWNNNPSTTPLTTGVTNYKTSPKSSTEMVTGKSITDDKHLLDTICSNRSLDVRLRNSNTKEFLYAASDYWAEDEKKRTVFTWKDLKDIPGIKNDDEWSQEETWCIEPFDQGPLKSFLLRNLKTKYGPKPYLFVGSSGGFVYVRRGLSDNDSPVLTIGLSATWRLLAKLVDQTKLRDDICNIDTGKIQGWVLMNVKFAPECINGDANDFNEFDSTKKRGNVRMALEGPFSYWDILPISTYQPSSIPIAPPRNWKDGPQRTKWDINCDFFDYKMANSINDLSDLECMDRCIINSDCTHWTYSILNRNCELKKATEIKEKFSFMTKCGFITGRSEQKY